MTLLLFFLPFSFPQDLWSHSSWPTSGDLIERAQSHASKQYSMKSALFFWNEDGIVLSRDKIYFEIQDVCWLREKCFIFLSCWQLLHYIASVLNRGDVRMEHWWNCTMGTGSFSGVKSGRGVTLTPHPLLVPWSWKGRAIPLLPLWAVRPVQSLSACTRAQFTFFFFLVEGYWWEKIYVGGKETLQLSLCPPQFSKWPNCEIIRTFVLTGRRLKSWVRFDIYFI